MSSLSYSSKVLILGVIFLFQCIEMRDGISPYRSALGGNGAHFPLVPKHPAIYCVTIQRERECK